MRSDFPETVLESNRRAYRDARSYSDLRASLNRSRSDDYDDLPAQESMFRPYVTNWYCRAKDRGLRKISAVRRWLQGQVGRAWSEVHSEACRVRGGHRGSAPRNFRWEVESQVELDVRLLDDGKVVNANYGFALRNGELYVDDDGILRVVHQPH